MSDRPDAGRHRIVALDTVDSTNSEAMRRAGAGERGPLWITARTQTAGRGRSGRSWSTAGGSLAASLLIAPRCAPADLNQLALLAGVATHDAVCEALPASSRAHVRLKWPNDVLIGGAKTAGILIESTTLGGELVAVIGIGINIAEAPPVTGRAVTHLANHGAIGLAPEALLDRLAGSHTRWMDTWAAGRGFPAIRTAFLERSLPLGSPITVNVNAGAPPVAGRFDGLDAAGGLRVVGADGAVRTFSYGDVTLGPATTGPEKD